MDTTTKSWMVNPTPASWDPYEVWRQRILLPRLDEQRLLSAEGNTNEDDLESPLPNPTMPDNGPAND